ncbi:unnamed protein product, partial [Amoebophrya sp. A120]
ELLKRNTLEDLLLDLTLQEQIVGLTARTKMVIASKDPKDDLLNQEEKNDVNGCAKSTNSTKSKGQEPSFEFSAKSYPREILNFGHTIGHAVEAESGIGHGHCVSIGMVAEMIDLPDDIRLEVENTMSQYSMMTKLPHHLSTDNMLKYLLNDKKMGRLVTIERIGLPRIFTPTPQELKLMMTHQRGLLLADEQKKATSKNNDVVEIDIPASKSITNRAILLAAMCEPDTTQEVIEGVHGRGGFSHATSKVVDNFITLENVLFAEDTLLLLRALEQLGVAVSADREKRQVVIEKVGLKFGSNLMTKSAAAGLLNIPSAPAPSTTSTSGTDATCSVDGAASSLSSSTGGEAPSTSSESKQKELSAASSSSSRTTLYLGNSGTCVRFLSGILGLHATADIVLEGVARMKVRPIQPLVDALAPFVAVERLDANLNTFKVVIKGQTGRKKKNDVSRTSAGGSRGMQAGDANNNKDGIAALSSKTT